MEGVALRPGYREFAVPVPYAHALHCWWTDDGQLRRRPLRVLPDGCVDLIWQQGYGVFVAGPDTRSWRPTNQPSTGPSRANVAVRFRPGAGGAALGLPLRELADQRVRVEDLTDVLPDRLVRQLAEVDDVSAALRLIPAVGAELVRAGQPDPAVRRLVHRLETPGAKVATLADEIGLSERQLRRRCEAAVGYGAKTLDRVLRFRRFLDRVSAAGPDDRRGLDLAVIAAEVGYADQAHLSRECRRLADATPTELAIEY